MFFLSAQEEFAPVGAKWYHVTSEYPIGNQVLEITSEKDTLVNGTMAKKLSFILWSQNGDILNEYFEIMYGDDSFVYHFKNGEFYKYYDFTLEVGDSMTLFFEPFENFDSVTLTVDSIAYNEFDGDTLKVIYPTYNTADVWCKFYGPIIQRIGNTFSESNYFCNDSVFSVRGPTLLCYEDNNIKYQFSEELDCKLDISNNIPNEIHSLITISPNPFNEYVSVCGLRLQKLSFKLFDINGQFIFGTEDIVMERCHSLTLPNLMKGIYYLQINDKDSTYPLFKILKL